MESKKILTGVIVVVLAGIFLGFLMPVGLNSVQEDTTINMNIGENAEKDITGLSTVYIDDINNTGATNYVNLTLNDTKNDKSYSVTAYKDGDSNIFNTDLGDINVTVETVNNDNVDLKITHPKTLGFGPGVKGIYLVLPIMLILIPLGILAGYVIKNVR